PSEAPAASVCASCGAAVGPGLRLCVSCGAAVAPASQDAPEARTRRVSNQYCGQCGAPASSGMFCTHCGARTSGDWRPAPTAVTTASVDVWSLTGAEVALYVTAAACLISFFLPWFAVFGVLSVTGADLDWWLWVIPLAGGGAAFLT